MREKTANTLARLLTFKCNEPISAPRRRLVRALTMDYLDYTPDVECPDGGIRFTSEESNGRHYIFVERVRKLGGGYASSTIGICEFKEN